jgi:DnaJ-class molecular chaperone
MVQASTNYYSILGIDQNASQTQAKTMYHKLAKKN